MTSSFLWGLCETHGLCSPLSPSVLLWQSLLKPVSAELILPWSSGMAPAPVSTPAALRALTAALPISNHPLGLTQGQHLDFVCFSALPQKAGQSSMDFTGPLRKGTLIYWQWCKFTRLIYRRERPAAGSLTQENCIFFCHWCVFLDANLSLTFCSCKKR